MAASSSGISAKQDLISQLDKIGALAEAELQSSGNSEAIEKVRVGFLGKKGKLSEVLRGLKDVDPKDRPAVGAKANEWKARLEGIIESRKSEFGSQELLSKIQSERIDISLPSREQHRGGLHPLTQTTLEIVRAFARLGFDVTTGPEIDTEFLTFDAINIPKDHPARDMQDTFFVGPGLVLRTHTSPVQMRTLLAKKWPVRILAPGAVYRCDNDATHSPMFHQIEGLWVDRGVKMSDLRGVLDFFAKEIFGSKTKVRMRPSYFPFVEPGAEIDVSCFRCVKTIDSHCPVCKGSGWVEILGAGMVHPHLFEVAGYDPAEVTGFAFGLGIERITMLLYQIPDLRLMFQGDMRFLKQFS